MNADLRPGIRTRMLAMFSFRNVNSPSEWARGCLLILTRYVHSLLYTIKKLEAVFVVVFYVGYVFGV